MSHVELASRITALRDTLKDFTTRFTFDPDESLDLVQDTILKALTYQDKFTDDTNLKGWLFTIMRNTFINKYHRKRRIRRLYDTTGESFYLHVEDPHTFSAPDRKSEYEDIWKNIHQIREEFLIPFKMHTSGYKYHEIAEHLNVPIGTVKNRIFHARKEIQKKLAGY